MERRSFCNTLALIPLGAFLAACSRPQEAPPMLDPAAVQAVEGKDTPQLLAALLIADWAPDTPAGLIAGYSIHETDPTGTPAITVAFNLSYPTAHRVSYAVFDAVGDASRFYAATAAALRDDSRASVPTYLNAPYPTTAIFYADLGRGVILLGPVMVRILATGTNRRTFNALLVASVAHLVRALAQR